jgi:acyl-CoA dehydrogenase
MDFALTQEQETIRDSIAKICARFDDDYWLKKDSAGGFPVDFFKAFAGDGWLGICIPPEFGGAGLGLTEATVMMQTIAESGAGLSGASALHMNIFGLNPRRAQGRALPALRSEDLDLDCAGCEQDADPRAHYAAR